MVSRIAIVTLVIIGGLLVARDPSSADADVHRGEKATEARVTALPPHVDNVPEIPEVEVRKRSAIIK